MLLLMWAAGPRPERIRALRPPSGLLPAAPDRVEELLDPQYPQAVLRQMGFFPSSLYAPAASLTAAMATQEQQKGGAPVVAHSVLEPGHLAKAATLAAAAPAEQKIQMYSRVRGELGGQWGSPGGVDAICSPLLQPPGHGLIRCAREHLRPVPCRKGLRPQLG